MGAFVTRRSRDTHCVYYVCVVFVSAIFRFPGTFFKLKKKESDFHYVSIRKCFGGFCKFFKKDKKTPPDWLLLGSWSYPYILSCVFVCIKHVTYFIDYKQNGYKFNCTIFDYFSKGVQCSTHVFQDITVEQVEGFCVDRVQGCCRFSEMWNTYAPSSPLCVCD